MTPWEVPIRDTTYVMLPSLTGHQTKHLTVYHLVETTRYGPTLLQRRTVLK